MSRTLVELCAGTASVSLWALARCAPLTGFMGSKRRWAALFTEAMDCDRPDRVVLVDAGPWGDVWAQLREPSIRHAVAGLLLVWDGRPVQDLWTECAGAPPSTDPVQRVAQYLWLQARSAGTIPVWWSPERERWESPTGSKTEAAHTRGGGALMRRQKGAAGRAYDSSSGRDTRGGRAAEKGCRGIQRPGTLARRVAALDRLPWERVEVLAQDVRTVAPIPGARVLFDPPYLGCPRYAVLLPREDVLTVALRHQQAGRVVVCEGEALPLEGWSARRLPNSRREWVTASWPLALPEQLSLWEAA